MMRILYVSWYFPPANTIAARRTGKMVKRFIELGAQVQVLTHQPCEDFAQGVVQPVDFHDRDAAINPAEFCKRLRKSTPKSDKTQASAPTAPYKNNAVWEALRRVYTYGVLFPDKHVGWRRHLKPALEQAIETFKPDVIYVSAPPHSQVKPVSQVARKYDLPWVAEFRDLWADEPFPQAPKWRRKLDKFAERPLVKSARAIVTVSDPWKKHYQKSYPGIPVHTTMNGFDPADFAFEASKTLPSKRLEIVYAGALYPGRRDPSPLFAAIRDSDLTPEDIRVRFYSDYNSVVQSLAHQYGVQDYVEGCPPTDYANILRIQKAADVLLLLQWTDPRNDGNVPAKVFEQLALRRPVLGIGPLNGVPARLLEDRNAGLVATDPIIIKDYITQMCRQKKEMGCIEMLPPKACVGLERNAQFDALYDFLKEVLPS